LEPLNDYMDECERTVVPTDDLPLYVSAPWVTETFWDDMKKT